VLHDAANKVRKSVSALLAAALILSLAAPSVADPPAGGRAAGKPKKAAKMKGMPGLTPEREATAMAFVRKHHPELADLLVVLKQSGRREYDKAMSDLFRSSERLAQYHSRGDLERYQLELRLWKTKSRIQLAAAQLRMSPSDTALREQLETTLKQYADLKIESMERERARYEQRAKRLAEQIEAARRKRDESVERQLQTLLRGKSVKRAKSRKTAPPAP